MSLRDNPESSKIIVPLVAGLAINRAYDPSSGGIGGPGRDRTTLPEKWVTQPGVDPAILCNNDPETDPYLALWFDAKDTDTLVLAPKEYDEETGKLLQRRVLEWKDKSRFHRNAVAVLPKYAPKLSQQQPFFLNAVDFAPVCIDPASDETDPGGGGGCPGCPEDPLVMSCGVLRESLADSRFHAGGDWRDGPGSILLSCGMHRVDTTPWDPSESYTLTRGAFCPLNGLAPFKPSLVLSYTADDYCAPGSVSGPNGDTGFMFNADPGKDGSVQLVFAGEVEPDDYDSAPWSGSWSTFVLRFKDADKALGAAGNSMAGRQVTVQLFSGTLVHPGDPDNPVKSFSATISSTGEVFVPQFQGGNTADACAGEGTTEYPFPTNTYIRIDISAP